jgi:hypothetical protein
MGKAMVTAWDRSYKGAVKQVIIRIVGAVREPPLQGMLSQSQFCLYDGNWGKGEVIFSGQEGR